MLAACDVIASEDDMRVDAGRPVLAAGLKAAGLSNRPGSRPEELAATTICAEKAANYDSQQDE
jgi:hypothetical protein